MKRLSTETGEMATDEWIERLIELESDVRYQEYASTDEPEYLYVAGTLPVLVSAPHGAVHTRDGGAAVKITAKEEDEYTAGLARLLGSRTGAYVIYARRKSRTDPNADVEAPYKQVLLQIARENGICFVLDLHGAKKEQDFGVALGTVHGASCSVQQKQIIVRTFRTYGISEAGSGLARLDVDQRFPGKGDERRQPVVKFCQSHSLPAAQIEINAWLRIPLRRADATSPDKDFKGDPGLIRNLVEALSEVVISIANQCPQ